MTGYQGWPGDEYQRAAEPTAGEWAEATTLGPGQPPPYDYPGTNRPGKSPLLVIGLVVTAGVIGLVAILVTLVAVRSGAFRFDAAPTSAAGQPSATSESGNSPWTTPDSVSTTSPPATAPSNEDEAYAYLEGAVRADAARVSDAIEGRWSPQIGSKKLGLVADDKTWSYRDIAELHIDADRRYGGVLLLDGSAWGVFVPGHYVMIVDRPSDSPDAVLAWCREQSLGRGDCLAKRVAQSGSWEANTRMQP